ncbi:MAG: hypothetical protein WCK84_01150 [Bacteroidota bacterium]
MKKLLLFLIMVLSQTLAVFSQDEPVSKSSATNEGEIKTLFKKSDTKIKIGYYLGPESAYTQFKGRDVFLGGLSLGVIINHFFSVGLSGYGIMNSRQLWYDNIIDTTGAYLSGGYGGVKFEFRILATSPVHVNFPILIGGGGLVYNSHNYNNRDYSKHNYNDNKNKKDDCSTIAWDSFFVVEPGVMIELNLLKFMRLDAGISYRYTPDLNLVNTSSGLINNFNANLSLKFGKF